MAMVVLDFPETDAKSTASCFFWLSSFLIRLRRVCVCVFFESFFVRNTRLSKFESNGHIWYEPEEGTVLEQERLYSKLYRNDWNSPTLFAS